MSVASTAGWLLTAMLAFGTGAAAHPPLEQAALDTDRRLAEDPTDRDLLLFRASLHHDRGEWDEAVVLYERAAGLGAERAPIDLALSRTFLGAGLPRTAELYADRVAQADPAAAVAFLARGRARLAQGRSPEGAADLGHGIALQPRPEPAQALEALRAQADAGDVAGALATADDAMAKIGVVASLQLPAIELERAQGRLAAAIARLDALLATAPDHPGWLAQRGDLLAAAGRPQEARVARERALEVISQRSRRRPGERLAALETRIRAELGPHEDSEQEGETP